MRPMERKSKPLPRCIRLYPTLCPPLHAQNFVNVQIDEDSIREYLREKRTNGIRMNHMTVMIAAYLRTCANHPALNRFVMNRRIYARNHFCVSFVILKPTVDGQRGETVIKVYLDLDDDIFTVHEKLQTAIKQNSEAAYNNTMDKFVNFMLSLPGLVRFIVATARFLDNYGGFPGRSLIFPRSIHPCLSLISHPSIPTTLPPSL